MKRFAHVSFNKFKSPIPAHRYFARNIVSSEKDAVRTASSEGPELSTGLNWGLAGKGVIVKEKVFQNLTAFELRQKGATNVEHSLSVPFLIRGNEYSRNSKLSRAQFTKLLKQVTSYISSVSELYVHDGAISSLLKCDAKVRIVSDSPSSVLSLSKLLWRTPSRAVSHDTCPLTVYVASSISSSIGESLGIKGDNGFIAADTERSSLILCGKAFADVNGAREALTALSEPIIISRGGLPLSAGLLVSSNLVMLLFAPEDSLRKFSDVLVSPKAGVVISSEGVSPLFQIGNSGGECVWKLPSVVILATSDSSGMIPSIAKLTPGQAAYHFLVGHQNGKFTPAYSKNISVDPLQLAKGLLSKLQENQISSFLINLNEGQTLKTGMNLVDLVQSALQENIWPSKLKGGDLKRRYKSFLSNNFQELPKEFSF
ncbi:uncharacterized protein LOC108225000 isoform X1 [Daucus carota subsp. sativus]|uniref:uncharacterized protein LOC108225000 isoform X1 n=1 Tax=Daucus carota subsp. sativus TaxID=79200 RepID=UPI0007EFEB02|nr:PREDICTED: uncharacterized protein LOC108225000 isoform X1 [Daucus carota subsp. sativus]